MWLRHTDLAHGDQALCSSTLHEIRALRITQASGYCVSSRSSHDSGIQHDECGRSTTDEILEMRQIRHAYSKVL
jgi:hypothetical protein